MSNQVQSLKQLQLIRLSLVLGVALFAALTIYRRTTGVIPDATEAEALRNIQLLRYGVWGTTVVAIIVAVLLKTSLAGNAYRKEQVVSRLIMGWAPGEIAAFMGVIQYFLGGSLATMLIGCFAFLVVLGILRIPANFD